MCAGNAGHPMEIYIAFEAAAAWGKPRPMTGAVLTQSMHLSGRISTEPKDVAIQ